VSFIGDEGHSCQGHALAAHGGVDHHARVREDGATQWLFEQITALGEPAQEWSRTVVVQERSMR
jgi:hypothetical protein